MKMLRNMLFLLPCVVAISMVVGGVSVVIATTPADDAEQSEEDVWTAPWNYGPRGGFSFSWEPWGELRDLQDRVNRIIDDAYWRYGKRDTSRGSYTGFGFYPETDVVESEKEIVVRCDLPGLDREQIEVTFKDGNLVISGTRETVKEESGEAGWFMRERSYGSFERVIPIQVGVKEDEISAEYKDGVLTVILPKLTPEKERGKKIRIL
jgi:HSP20 family protein